MEYVTLKVIWWGIITFLVIAFAITGGMDIGVNILLPIVGRNETDRRLILSAVGPTWEGNQVWLVTFGAALFAVWPSVYATAFSSLYFALMLALLMLILRPPGLDYRTKIDSATWRQMWDLCLIVGGVVLALVFGVAIGNLFIGLPFTFDENLLPTYTGSLLSLFSPFTILFGIVSLSMLSLQGSLFLQYKLENHLVTLAKQAVQKFGYTLIGSFILAGIYTCFWMPGYAVLSIPDINTGFDATRKIVAITPSGWLSNYVNYPLLWLLPIGALIYTYLAMRISKANKPGWALIINSMAIAAIIFTAAAALFPFILPSSSQPNHSLTIWDAASSYKSLCFSLSAVLIFLPIVLIYTSWVYKIMHGKVNLKTNSY